MHVLKLRVGFEGPAKKSCGLVSFQDYRHNREAEVIDPIKQRKLRFWNFAYEKDVPFLLSLSISIILYVNIFVS